ncbi:MAG: tRNA uridine-5-carboxymethylaminomethyl(34) synthesis GTPase MnmE [Saprospiraceae bacterium]|nr:tRNA uridine-5-carboxymethylaminomethyl(34) synthesis GTPase MnmE [Saprospiraceae bacterium]
MQLPDLSSTIVALATPPGVGAIGVIRVSGDKAITLAEEVFSGVKLSEQPSHTAHFGHIKDLNGDSIDEVLVTVFQGRRSYTGEPTVEISCHGSPFILQKVIDLFLQKGARLAEPGEFTLRAFLNGKLDLSQAEAVADLIASESAAQHRMALNQLRGGVKNKIRDLREELIHFASMVELELDFGEEDVEFADRDDLKELVYEIRAHLRPLIESFALGNAIKTGVVTVIAGRPNAGKSTLLNALLDEERAIVSDIPGTTRDTIEEVLNIKGVQFRLVDTAGIRDARDTIERIGVERTMKKIEQAGILVYVWDVTSGMTIVELWAELLRLLNTQPDVAPPQLMLVCNKMDRNPQFRIEWVLQPEMADIHPYLRATADEPIGETPFQRVSRYRIIPVSAKNHMNIEFLKEKLFEMAVGDTQSAESEVIVNNARHHDALRRADSALNDVLSALDTNISGDFIAQDIRRALSYLGEITGQIGVEELLGNIFGKFCIGK